MRPPHEQRVQAAQQAIAAFRLLGHAPLLEDITIEWRSRFTRRLGEAEYQKAPLITAIRFSVPLWERATPEEREQCVIHEVCHIVDFHQAALAARPFPKPHGNSWKALMRRCGQNPDRCHFVNRTGLRRKQKRHPAICGCEDKIHMLSGQRVSRILKGRGYHCTACGERLAVLSTPAVRDKARAASR